MVVHIKSGKRENGMSFWCNLYRKRSIRTVRPRQGAGLPLSDILKLFWSCVLLPPDRISYQEVAVRAAARDIDVVSVRERVLY